MTACIHGLTIRKSEKPVEANRIGITLLHTESHHFPKDAKVILALESDPAVQIHATIRKSAKPTAARLIEIPLSHAEAHHFPKGAAVVLALESDPTIQIQAKVWGGKRRYCTIRRKQENSNRFLIGADVMLMLDAEVI